MNPASAKQFLLRLLNGTDFKLNLSEANDLIQAYKWFHDLDVSEKKQMIKKDPIKKKAK